MIHLQIKMTLSANSTQSVEHQSYTTGSVQLNQQRESLAIYHCDLMVQADKLFSPQITQTSL